MGDKVLQVVALVLQAVGNLFQGEYFQANNNIIVTGTLVPMKVVCRLSGSNLVTKQKLSSRVFLARGKIRSSSPLVTVGQH